MARITIIVGSIVAVSSVWLKGGGGQSCDVACARFGGCDNQGWPDSLESFQDLMATAGLRCADIQEGMAKYDPSTDGQNCGWKGPSWLSSRCDTAGDATVFRLCPCLAEPSQSNHYEAVIADDAVDEGSDEALGGEDDDDHDDEFDGPRSERDEL